MTTLSGRIPNDLSPNRLAAARARIGDVPYDLTVSNPTRCGFEYPVNLLEGLNSPSALVYRPDPRGPRSGREAVAAEYRRWSFSADPDRVTLTASTSEAYSFLFKLLCDPGDAILVPSPSYPLFDHLARLDAVECIAYDLEPDGGWRIDFAQLETAPGRVRAVVVVHPNNPTGSYVHPVDADRLVTLCRDRGWALIADEVFLSFPLDGGPGEDRTFAAVADCLCFTLGGLSKSVALPQLKLAWIIAGGPEEEVRSSLESLDVVADAYLSVSTPIATAAPGLLTAGTQIRPQIGRRCRANLETLRRIVRREPSMSVLPAGGGWCAVLRLPQIGDEDEFYLRLLTECGVAIHPGYFYDFPAGGYAVVSLLSPEEAFGEGVRRLTELVGRTINA